MLVLSLKANFFYLGFDTPGVVNIPVAVTLQIMKADTSISCFFYQTLLHSLYLEFK